MYKKINLAMIITLPFTSSVFAQKDSVSALSPSSKTINITEKETKLNQKNFFAQETLTIFTERINKITPQSQRVWGTMTPDQMLHHLNLACGSSMGYFDLPDESSFMTRTMGKWYLVSWKPNMPKGLKKPVGFKIKPDEHFDLEKERSLLLEILTKAVNTKSTESWTPHVLFGKLTKKQWSKLLTKHLDYHLKQFGV